MKNFMKRAALLLLMITSAFPVWAEVLSGSCGENATYILDTESGLLKIEGEGPMTDYASASRCPWYDYVENIRRVEVSNGITVIAGFMECPNLQSVEIPNSVTFIGFAAFGGCTNLSAVQLPNSLMYIGPSAFASCSNLSEITIPESVKQVDFGAFRNCFVTKDNYHNNSSCVDSEIAPSWEPTLCDLEQADGLLIKDNEAVHFRPWATSISVPEGVTVNFSSLMGHYIHLNCDLSLTSINIPASFSDALYGGIFYIAKNLLSVNISNDNQVYCSIDGVVYNKEQTMLLVCPVGKTSITIPNTVTIIDDYALSTPNLTSVTIPSSVTSIRYGAFQNCSGLTSITCMATTPPVCESDCFYNVPKNVTLYVPEASIDAYKAANQWKNFGTIEAIRSNQISGSCGENATYTLDTETGVLRIEGTGNMDDFEPEQTPWYDYRDIITEVQIADGIEMIGRYAFGNCSALTSVEIPESITSIGDEAFQGCISLCSPIYNDKIFAFLPESFSGEYNIPEGITTIVNGAFFGRGNLTSVTIPNSVTSIGDGAFMYCGGLRSVVIPSSVTYIGAFAFAECSGIESLTIKDGVREIEECAFGFCSALTSVNIPNSVVRIAGRVFESCTSLESITIPEHVTTIGYLAFSNCKKLATVVLPETIEWLGSGIFNECSSLTSITCLSEIPPTLQDANSFVSVPCDVCVLYVHSKSVNAYKSAEGWREFENIVGLERTIELVDGEDYTNANEESYNTITYTRTFTNTSWNALYVPFAMSYEDWSADFEVARLNDVHQFDDDEDGEIDRTVLESVKLKAGSSIEPNTPYMIKAKEAGEKTITLTDATLYAAEENSFDVTSWFTKFTFTGTYSTVTDMATKGHYAVANGGLMKASSDAVTLGAFRWYLDVTDRNGNPAPLKAKKVFLSFDDGETTAIDVVEANTTVNGNGVYSISGVNVGNSKASLPKGFYISNGKKYLIK